MEFRLVNLKGLFDEEPINSIIKSPLLFRNRPDKPVCILNNKGELSIISAYGISQSHRFAQAGEELLGSLRI